MTTSHLDVGVKVVAAMEHRNADGELVDRPVVESVEHVRVDLVDLRESVERRGLTDEQLAAMGFTENDIRQIRSA